MKPAKTNCNFRPMTTNGGVCEYWQRETPNMPEFCYIGDKCPTHGQCPHDLDNPIRQGRAHFTCRLCGKDITLMMVLLEEAKRREKMNDSR